MTTLLKYDAACRAIAEAKTVDEVKAWIDKAAAVREYGRRIKNRQMELDAAEIRVQAKRRRGELLRELRDDGRLYEGKRKLSAPNDSLTLDDLEVSRNESSEEQELAAMDGDSFKSLMARCRAYVEAHPEKHSINPLKPPPVDGPINGSRSVMGSRQEPDDSLDYFPTPPWATRALMERVWPIAVPSLHIGSVWEPACGEGHIAEVLREYCREIVATDIHDYGYGETCDFLGHSVRHCVDWIITNPPFGDNAEAFVLRAIEQTRVGVAMFFRLQWLESVGRYESIFKPHPPSLIAQFVERVPLHKGRWEPNGATATAYLWIVWMPIRQQSRGLTEFMWIPPGCREALTRPDDAERFTAHPVIKKLRTADDGSPTDPDTGEIHSETDAAQAPTHGVTEPAPDVVAPADGAGSPLPSSDSEDFEPPEFLKRDKQNRAPFMRTVN